MKLKDYIKQFYTEGFATTFYQKPTKYVNKKIKTAVHLFLRSYRNPQDQRKSAAGCRS